MENRNELVESAKPKTPGNLVTNLYRSYRQWQKQKGRQKRAVKDLQTKTKFYSKLIQNGDLCFDVGANVGNRTEAFLKLGARIVAVEPQPECIAVLNELHGDRYCDDIFVAVRDDHFLIGFISFNCILEDYGATIMGV